MLRMLRMLRPRRAQLVRLKAVGSASRHAWKQQRAAEYQQPRGDRLVRSRSSAAMMEGMACRVCFRVHWAYLCPRQLRGRCCRSQPEGPCGVESHISQ